MRQFGEDEWKRMSEKERQKKLMEMKMKERKLRKEGERVVLGMFKRFCF